MKKFITIIASLILSISTVNAATSFGIDVTPSDNPTLGNYIVKGYTIGYDNLEKMAVMIMFDDGSCYNDYYDFVTNNVEYGINNSDIIGYKMCWNPTEFNYSDIRNKDVYLNIPSDTKYILTFIYDKTTNIIYDYATYNMDDVISELSLTVTPSDNNELGNYKLNSDNAKKNDANKVMLIFTNSTDAKAYKDIIDYKCSFISDFNKSDNQYNIIKNWRDNLNTTEYSYNNLYDGKDQYVTIPSDTKYVFIVVHWMISGILTDYIKYYTAIDMDDLPTSINAVSADVNTLKYYKQIENGKVVIYKNDQKFTTSGAELK